MAFQSRREERRAIAGLPARLLDRTDAMTVGRWLEARFPPPIVALAVVVMMWSVATWPPMLPAPAIRKPIALLLVILALVVEFAAVLSFRRARTTINPMAPQNSTALVTGGVYRVTRNPMYVGLTTTLTALAIGWGSLWSLSGPLLFALFIGRFQILPEERVLEARFGDAYRAYRARVRRWL